jgi:hypothetical protein
MKNLFNTAILSYMLLTGLPPVLGQEPATLKLNTFALESFVVHKAFEEGKEVFILKEGDNMKMPQKVLGVKLVYLTLEELTAKAEAQEIIYFYSVSNDGVAADGQCDFLIQSHAMTAEEDMPGCILKLKIQTDDKQKNFELLRQKDDC